MSFQPTQDTTTQDVIDHINDLDYRQLWCVIESSRSTELVTAALNSLRNRFPT